MGTKQPGNKNDIQSGSSRFTYHNDVAGEQGGVRRAGGVAGAPGPAERLLDISELARSLGMRYIHGFEIPPHPADDIEYLAPLVGEVTLSNTGALLLLRGQVRTQLRLECGRCLEPVVQDLETELEEEFDLVTTRNAFYQEEVQAVDEDTPASVIEGNVLNFAELLRQNLLLAAPLQPLCREDCAGLDATGRKNVQPAATAEPAPDDVPGNGENPLRRLAALLAEKRGETQT